MKLVIQIPCYNEEQSLPITLASIPRVIPGVDQVEILVIDDGSSDKTSQVAVSHRVHKVVRLPVNQGLARAFIVALESAVDMGADIIVNLDADNQYDASCIGDLIAPIVRGQADIVIGVRDISSIDHFSTSKKFLQKIGSWVVRKISKTAVEDVTSGFRAYNRRAAMYLNVFSRFTYTLETIIQAGYSSLSISTVPIKTNEKLRESRLFLGASEYVRRSIFTILKIYTVYQPFKAFSLMAFFFALPGVVLVCRFFYYYFTLDSPTGHTQSLIIALIFLAFSFMLFVIGVLADLLAVNRRLLENIQYALKKIDHRSNVFSEDRE
ncbi:glycosyltransferase family 2 protein [Thermodesulfobacteriota bacterium]